MIYIGNPLIWDYWNDMSHLELKLFFLLLNQIQPYDKQFDTYTIATKDLLAEFNRASGGKARKLLQQAFNNLKASDDPDVYYKTFHLWQDPNVRLRILSEARFIDGGKSVELCLHDDLNKYLLGLKKKKNFTLLNYDYIANFKLPYSIILYTILKSKQFDKDAWTWEKTVPALRRILGCTDTYHEFADFRKYAIEKANVELKKAGIAFEPEFVRNNRKIYHNVTFICKRETPVIPTESSAPEVPAKPTEPVSGGSELPIDKLNDTKNEASETLIFDGDYSVDVHGLITYDYYKSNSKFK